LGVAYVRRSGCETNRSVSQNRLSDGKRFELRVLAFGLSTLR
jgi:hypothetical protein